jgi:hypothetical protein
MPYWLFLNFDVNIQIQAQEIEQNDPGMAHVLNCLKVFMQMRKFSMYRSHVNLERID